ncbi:MarR family transcriptional regulator [Aeoliella sp. ICT_H6.2]|uniref:MarR family transcriptional regulator n=1 Tax=Aeoliella straminimaris TaxID=2954799 RepID=A0A9X2JGA1_9BACT|nr:MarR family transcriptional regulator [Aeoliella straminimaris]MCO6044531.1 MarR family transcriptional regulator [Aeoliella straminimaris]
MLRYDFDDSVGYWITSSHQAYMRAFNDRLEPHGITFRQAQLLAFLAMEGRPLSQTELAARMLIEPPSLVGILDRAEEAGLIERRCCDQDRRRKLIHILPTAQKVWKQIAKCGREIRQQAVKGLSEDEVKTLRYLLDKVRENVSSDETAVR